MTDFGNNELRRLDLTVLLVFLGLVRLRKATAVAAELGLTQSGVSQALKRLRDVFGDELFLRRPHGLDPTSVALSLEPLVAAAVASLREALGGTRPFDAASATGVLRLSALDAEQAVLVPHLLVAMRALAPGMRLSVVGLKRREVPDALASGQIDLALGFFPEMGDQFLGEPLFDQGYLVVASPKVMAKGPMTLERYLAHDHLLVSPTGDFVGIVDSALEGLGQTRRVVLTVPHFYAALIAIGATDVIGTLPDRLARAHAPGLGLIISKPPLALRRFSISLVRHRRNAADPRILWAADLIRAALAHHQVNTP